MAIQQLTSSIEELLGADAASLLPGSVAAPMFAPKCIQAAALDTIAGLRSTKA